MEATVVLVLFLVLICGGMTLMLAVGYQSVEERASRASRERSEAAASAKALSAVPSFFVAPDASIPSVSFVLDDALVRQLEQQIRIEQAVVAQFVHHPSVDSLYRATGASLHVH